MSPLVVGLGNPDRGDDGLGPAVVAALPAYVATTVLADPTGLLDILGGHDLVVVVDCVRSTAPPGTLLVLEAGADLPPIRTAQAVAASSHALDLGAVLELARAVRRLPRRVVVVAVTADQLAPGAPLSAPVARAVPLAVRTTLEILRTAD